MTQRMPNPFNPDDDMSAKASSPVTHNPQENAFYEKVDPRKTMTPEAQRIAIAKACGWKKKVVRDKGDDRYIPPTTYITWDGPRESGYCVLPDYLSDLNAMHEAEKGLSETQCDNYGLQINTIMHRDAKLSEHPRQYSDWHATAAQRAEAFLKATGKWVAP